jgi:hypothetical protein
MRLLDSSCEQSEAQYYQQNAKEPVVRPWWNPAEHGDAEQRANSRSDRCSDPQWNSCSDRLPLRKKVDRNSCGVDQEGRGGGCRYQLTGLELETEQCRRSNSALVPDETAEQSGSGATEESPNGGLGQGDASLTDLTGTGYDKQ